MKISFSGQTTPRSSCVRKETADRDITKISKNVTSQNNEWISHSNKEVETAQAVQINIYQNNITEKTQGGYIQTLRKGFKRMINSPTFLLLQLIPNIQRVTRSTNLVMKTVSHARSRSRFIETTSTLRRKKLRKESRLQFSKKQLQQQKHYKSQTCQTWHHMMNFHQNQTYPFLHQ